MSESLRTIDEFNSHPDFRLVYWLHLPGIPPSDSEIEPKTKNYHWTNLKSLLLYAHCTLILSNSESETSVLRSIEDRRLATLVATLIQLALNCARGILNRLDSLSSISSSPSWTMQSSCRLLPNVFRTDGGGSSKLELDMPSTW